VGGNKNRVQELEGEPGHYIVLEELVVVVRGWGEKSERASERRKIRAAEEELPAVAALGLFPSTGWGSSAFFPRSASLSPPLPLLSPTIPSSDVVRTSHKIGDDILLSR
jgi:hypothetical protein